MRVPAFIAAVLIATSTHALDVGGVHFADHARITPDGPELVLNGAGERWLLLFKVYAIGLYLPQKKGSMADVVALRGPKRLLLIVQRDLTGKQVHEYLVNRMEDASQASEMAVLKARMDDLDRIIDGVGTIAKDGTIALDWVPGKGTVIRVNDVVRGEPIAGEDFYNAFLRIWLSDRAKSQALREALLGRQSG